jgi:hypothetical protein
MGELAPKGKRRFDEKERGELGEPQISEAL